MDFAPYQDTPPETTRALSPPPAQSTSPRSSFTQSRNITDAISPQPERPQGDEYLSERDVDAATAAERTGSGWARGFGGRREDVDLFETSLGIRMDYEACLAYVLLPPAAGVALLMFEHKSDYVRFHAWQSSLLFTVIFIIHIIFSWSSLISWFLFVCDLVLIAWLTQRAYRDADTLDRCEVPFFGPLASSILDDE